jgi:hypothetical protein
LPWNQCPASAGISVQLAPEFADANQVLSDSTVLQVRAHDNLPEVLALAWQQLKLFDSIAVD